MAIEKKRGCGYRKVGGLYLVGLGMGIACGRLPYNIEICPVCGEGVRISRAMRKIDGTRFFGKNCDLKCSCHESGCVICNSDKLGTCWVMSVGKKFYTPEKFIQEAAEMGVSKRIARIPQEFVLGEHWVLLTHPEAGRKKTDNEEENAPAIFYAYKPQRIEKLMKESDATEDVVKELAKRNITVVKVPDNDTDHQGNVYDDKKEEEKQNRNR